MPEKCESMRYTRAATPPTTAPPPNQQSVWRATMHLKPYPKLVKSEIRLEPRGVAGPTQRGGLHVGQQGALLRTEWGVRQASITRGSNGTPSNSNHGNMGVVGSTGRYPLSVISTNTLRQSNIVNNNSSHLNNITNSSSSHRLSLSGEFYTTWARRAKISPSSSPNTSSPSTFTSSLLLLSPSNTSTGSENEGSLSLYQSGGEDGEGPLDIWAVIKPGNTKDKIAIFTSTPGRAPSSDRSAGGRNENRSSCGGSSSGDSTPEKEGVSPPAVAMLSRVVSMKVKGCWEGESSTAKRRRRSGNSHHHHHHNNHHLQEQRTKELHQQVHKPAEPAPAQVVLSQPTQPEGRVSGGERPRVGEEGEEGGKALSVVEMVAFLELRASEQQQLDSKPIISLQRSSTSITLSKAPTSLTPSAPQTEPQPREGAAEEEGESVKVSDMVAKLESECLKRRGLAGGELSRNNSLRRSVGRVLLAGADACAVSAQPPSPTPASADAQNRLSTALSVSSSKGPASPSDEPRSKCTSLASDPFSSASSADIQDGNQGLNRAGKALEGNVEVRLKYHVTAQTDSGGQGHSAGPPEQRPLPTEAPQVQCHSQAHVQLRLQTPPESDPQFQSDLRSTESPGQPPEEPLPGMLFFPCQTPNTKSPSPLPAQDASSLPQTLAPSAHHPVTDSEHSPSNSEAMPSLPVPQCPAHTQASEAKREGVRMKDEEEEEAALGEGGQEVSAAPFPLRRMVSHEFLEMRFKIQMLLEPQQYLAFLPHHIMVKIFSLLPTQSLAALKCTCHYFKFIIENYGVRPADSRWVSDARYKDDPCKQCKRRYGRGDVSLCRWHHKPYCQAMPYGPGYWMCCHGSHKDTPGCNVGLHDNRWVPAFHSMPIYKRNRDPEEELEPR